jgi:putative ABC transport system permease protein
VDVERANVVCVLGQTVVDQLFGELDPIGETIRVNNEPCVVAGVLAVKGQSATGQDQDDQFLMPYSTVMKKIKGQIWLDDIMCSATSASVLDQAEQEIAVIMRERHHIRPGVDDDFNLRHPTEIAEAVKQSTQTMEACCRDCIGVADRGRHRDHEHHARVGDGEDQGDRTAPGRWRPLP